MSQQIRDFMEHLTSFDNPDDKPEGDGILRFEEESLTHFLQTSQKDPWVTQQLRLMFHKARPDLNVLRLKDSQFFDVMTSSYSDWQELTNTLFRQKVIGHTANGGAVVGTASTDAQNEAVIEERITEEPDTLPGTRWVISEQLLYHDQKTPYAYVDYVLELASGKTLNGKTDAHGWIRHEVSDDEPFKIRLLEDDLDEIDDDPDVEGQEDDDTEDVPEEVLSATLMEESGREPLADVAVEISDLDETVYTDIEGYFEVINVDMGEYEIRVAGRRIIVPTHDEPNPSYKIILPLKPE